MKVVLLHDWLTGMRGGERVLEALCELYPQAPLYTLLFEAGTTSAVIEDRKITPSFLNKIPGIYKNYRKFLPLFPQAVNSLHIKEDADLVISTSHCVIKAVKKPNGAKHLSYIHSPMRYMYDQFDSYFGKHAPLSQQIGARVFRGYLTNYDIKSNENVDLMIANSEFVKSRIKKFYNRDSIVVNPFVDLGDFKNLYSGKENYFVMVTAFAPNKRVDLAIEAFNELKLPLKIIGGGQQENYLKQLAGPTIEFLGSLEREELIKVLSRAQALIFPGVEDFGITPLEALAAGTPVIALKAGGVLETLNNEVADFFTEANKESLIKTVKNFKAQRFSDDVLKQRVKNYSRESFKEKMMAQIQKLVST